MKSNKLNLSVSILTTCLTFFQSQMLMAQNETQIDSTNNLSISTEQQIQIDNRISPTYFSVSDSFFYGINNILIPKKGFVADLNLIHQEGQLNGKLGSVANSKTENKLTNEQATATIAYAFTKNIFLNFSFSYGHQSTDSSNSYTLNNNLYTPNTNSVNSVNKSGVSDPYIGAGYRLDFDSISTVFNLGANISTGDKNTDYTLSQSSAYDTKTSGTGDIKNGGYVVTPQIAIFNGRSSEYLVGANISYSFLGDRTSSESTTQPLSMMQANNYSNYNSYTYYAYANNSGTIKTSKDYKKTGGNVLNISSFVEIPFSKHRLGGTISYYSQDTTEEINITDHTTTDQSGVDLIAAAVYGNFSISKDLKIIPKISYGQLTKTPDGLDLNENSFLSGSINTRFYF